LKNEWFLGGLLWASKPKESGRVWKVESVRRTKRGGVGGDEAELLTSVRLYTISDRVGNLRLCIICLLSVAQIFGNETCWELGAWEFPGRRMCIGRGRTEARPPTSVTLLLLIPKFQTANMPPKHYEDRLRRPHQVSRFEFPVCARRP